MIPIELAIVKGIPVPSGHTTSNEAALEAVNLLDTGGFSLKEGGWIPKRPQYKAGATAPGVFGGKLPLTYADDNLVETFSLISNGVTRNSRDWLVMKLERMAQAVRDFHLGDYQRDPVYLKVWYPGATRPEYALVYNINIAPDSDPFSEARASELNITIEREPGNTFLAPGENPKIQTLELAGTTPTSSNLSLIDTGNLFTATIKNGTAINASTYASLQAGHVDVPAAAIPGDMPAMLQFTIAPPATGVIAENTTVYVATRSLPISYPNISAETHRNVFPAAGPGAGTIFGSDTSSVADANCITGNRATCTFVSAGNQVRVRFTPINMPLMSGRYAAFVRAYQSGGSAGTIFMQLQFNYDVSTSQYPQRLPEQVLRLPASSFYSMHYMGILDITEFGALQPVRLNGLYTGGEDAMIELWARRASGAGEMRVADLVLMPIDENYSTLFGTIDANSLSNGYIVYDSTRYFTRGQSIDYIKMTPQVGSTEIQGKPIMLRPGYLNRLYFIFEKYTSTPTNPESRPVGGDYVVRGNVLSRWAGVIDA